MPMLTTPSQAAANWQIKSTNDRSRVLTRPRNSGGDILIVNSQLGKPGADFVRPALFERRRTMHSPSVFTSKYSTPVKRATTFLGG
jgi:hypothetical protein